MHKQHALDYCKASGFIFLTTQTPSYFILTVLYEYLISSSVIYGVVFFLVKGVMCHPLLDSCSLRRHK